MMIKFHIIEKYYKASDTLNQCLIMINVLVCGERWLFAPYRFPVQFLLVCHLSDGGCTSVVPDGYVGERAVRFTVGALQVQHASHPLASAPQHV